jgi:superfamily II DNA or RNA helicase
LYGAENVTADGTSPEVPRWERPLPWDEGEPSPTPGGGFTLRPYQHQAIEGSDAFTGIFRAWEEARSTLLVLPTGCGKTVVFGTVTGQYANRMGGRGRGLILAHREELLNQAADEMAGLGIITAIEKAERKARESVHGDDCHVIASVQSMQGKRLQTWGRDDFDFIVIDEAHHAPSKSYRAIVDHFDTAKVLGVTATADRLDGENLGQIFETLAFEYSLKAAIVEGWLCRLKIVWCKTSVSLAQIRTTGGDLNLGDIEEAIAPYISELVKATVNEIGSRPTIVFTPDVGSAEAFADGLRQAGLTAAALSAKSKDRSEVVTLFHQGRYQVLCNCGLFTEGFNAPFVSAIVLARPTKSRALYSQMVGRGTRKHPQSGKTDCLIVDFDWLSGTHKLVKPTELFDTNRAGDETIKIADELLADGATDDLLEATEKAEEIRVERQKVRIKLSEKKAHYRRVAYDPFSVASVLDIPIRAESARVSGLQATPKQVDLLKKFGVTGAEDMSRKRAGLYLDLCIQRRKKGLATIKQVSWCIAKGADPDEARRWTFKEASAFLDTVFRPRVGR